MEAGINALSNGQWTELKHQAGYDVFYHLAVVINGRILIEKNSYGINIYEYEPYMAESIDVPRELLKTPMTIWSMLDKTEMTMKGNYFSYSPFRNNCQSFIYNLLQSNNVIDDQLIAFIYQPIDELVSKLDAYVEPMVNIASRLYGLHSLAELEGTGRNLRNQPPLNDVIITFQPDEVFTHDSRLSNFPDVYRESDKRFIWLYKLGATQNHGGKKNYFRLKDPLTLFDLDSVEGSDNFIRVLKALDDGEELVEAFKSKIKVPGTAKTRPKYITASEADQKLARGLAKHSEELGASGWKMTMASDTADPEYLVIDPKLFFHDPTKKLQRR
jgi:hypothetical protein